MKKFDNQDTMLVKAIINEYLDCKKTKKAMEKFSKDSSEYVSQLNSKIEAVDFALASVNDDSAYLISKDFLSNHDNEWWRKEFTRSTYYRHRKMAVKDFLRHYQLFSIC